MNPALYQQSKTCPACGRKFDVTKARNSACVVLKRDSDFRVVCSGIDPNLYTVWVCPHCGYAAGESTFEDLMTREKPAVKEALASRPLPAGTQGERTTEGAIAAYEQALFLGEVRTLSPSNLAGLHLKLAWVYRGLGDAQREQEHLVAARDLFRTAFDHERLGGPGKMSESTVAYLIGELARRTGDHQTAINWFSRLVSDPAIKQEPQLMNLVREQWYAARSEAAGEAEEPGPGGDAEPAASSPAATAEETGERAAATVPPPVRAVAPSVPGRNLPSASARVMQGRVSTMVPLYRDQAEWLQQVVIAAEGDARLTLADVIRAVLDVAIQEVPQEKLKASNEADLRGKLLAYFRDRGKDGKEEAS
jgi:hypothetical protein